MSRITRSFRHAGFSLVAAFLVVYFVYHTIEGDRGWLAMLRKTQELREAKAVLSQVQKERETLQHRTQLLRPESLDPDLLEEKSRLWLNYSRPGEIVILKGEETDTEGSGTGRPPALLRRNK